MNHSKQYTSNIYMKRLHVHCRGIVAVSLRFIPSYSVLSHLSPDQSQVTSIYHNSDSKGNNTRIVGIYYDTIPLEMGQDRIL